MVFRWLHISDIHYLKNIPNDVLRKTFLEQIRKEASEGHIDCVVITGDVFSRGDFSPECARNVKEFIVQIYEAAGIEKLDGKLDRLVFCPGNHDLNRNAGLCVPSPEGDVYLYRPDVLAKVAKRANDGDGSHLRFGSDHERKLLTQEAFRAYYALFEDLTGIRHTYPADYEAKIFTLKTEGFTIPIHFVALNTAVLAGQSPEHEGLPEQLQAQYSSFLAKHHAIQTKEALKSYEEYHRTMRKLIDYNEADDDGRIHFLSSESEPRIVRSHEDADPPIVFLVGHHTDQMFSPNAKQRFGALAFSLKARLYLCGHIHRSSEAANSFKLAGQNDQGIHQITVGGYFVDKAGYNQPGFSIGRVYVDDRLRDYAYIYEKIFTWARDPLGKYVLWGNDVRSDEGYLFKQSLSPPDNGQGGLRNLAVEDTGKTLDDSIKVDATVNEQSALVNTQDLSPADPQEPPPAAAPQKTRFRRIEYGGK